MQILVITCQADSRPVTGTQSRSWYTMRMLRKLGRVEAICLSRTEPTADTVSDPGWDREYSHRTLAIPSAMSVKGGGPLCQALVVLLTPWRRLWVPWLQYIQQYGQSRSPRLALRTLQILLQWQHQISSFAGIAPPTMCLGPLQQWLSLRHAVFQQIQDRHWDILWVENTVCWPVAADLLKGLQHRPRLVVLNGHNIEYRILEQQTLNCSDIRSRAFLAGESRLTRRLEQLAFRGSDLVFQCSEDDVRDVHLLAGHRASAVFANGVDTELFPPQADSFRDSAPTVLFPASFDYHPNREGAAFLLEAIWPRVLSRIPTARLILAGRAADTVGVPLLTTGNSVEIAANLPSMAAVFGRCWVIAVPLLSGGGTRLKILEALSSQRAVVSTTLGAAGVPYQSGVHLRLADTAEDFAAAICQLLLQETERQRLAAAGAAYVRQNYDWQQLAVQMLADVRAALQTHSR